MAENEDKGNAGNSNKSAGYRDYQKLNKRGDAQTATLDKISSGINLINGNLIRIFDDQKKNSKKGSSNNVSTEKKSNSGATLTLLAQLVNNLKKEEDSYRTDDKDPMGKTIKVLKDMRGDLKEGFKNKGGGEIINTLKMLVIGGAGYALGNLINMDDVKALGPVKILMKTYKVYQQTIKMMDKLKNVISGKTLFTKFGKIFDTVGDFFNPVTRVMDKAKDFFKPVTKVIDKAKDFFNPVMSVVDGAKKMFKPVAKLLGGGAKVGAVAGKLGLKALAKIPGLGLIAAVALSVPRFKKGDIIGGMMELASGAASIFPGIGTGIALAIDAALLMKDVAEGGWGKSVMNSVTSFLGFGGNKKKMEGDPRKGFIDNSKTGLVKTKLGRQSEGGLDSGIPIEGRATSLMSKSSVNLNNLDFGPNHDSIDGHILDSYGKHLGGSYSPVITSARRTSQGNAALEESVKKSKHLTGNALDLRVNDIDIKTSNKITRSLADALGKDFDVLQHGKGTNRHIHLEYDPKGTGYNNGGIVPGSSMTGDLVPVRVNSGEMILNRNQQNELFQIAKGGSVNQKIPRLDLAGSDSKSSTKEMMVFLEGKFASVLSNAIAAATETAVGKRPKDYGAGAMTAVDIT